MPRTNPLQLKREADIKALYLQLKAEKKFSDDYILATVGEKFYLQPKTVSRIIWGEYDYTRQKRAEAASGSTAARL